MNLCYEEWIHEHYPTKESARNNCWSATKAMIEAFPELIQTRGWYGWTEYWWCKTITGEVIDPTRHQFSRDAPYKEFREGIDPEPLGKCMNCGDYCWPFLNDEGEPVGENVPGAIKQEHVGSCHCSKVCYEALIREFN